MDTMNWAGQTCQAMLQAALPLLIWAALLSTGIITLAWVVANVTRRVG